MSLLNFAHVGRSWDLKINKIMSIFLSTMMALDNTGEGVSLKMTDENDSSLRRRVYKIFVMKL